ncbi:MAG: hypothetical protein ACR2P4_01745, partial [Gammaproteobacteria bacterium]
MTTHSEGKTMHNIIRAILVVLFIFGFGSLTACGGGGGGGSAAAPTPPAPPRYEVTAPELGAVHFSDDDNSWLFVVQTINAQGEDYNFGGQNVNVRRQQVTRSDLPSNLHLHQLDIAQWHLNMSLVPVVQPGGMTLFLSPANGQIVFATRPDITRLAQLCPARWIGDYLNQRGFTNGGRPICAYPGNTSYSPDMRRVVHAAMADTFHRGIGIGESNFAFSGRHNGNDRAAGFTYDMGSFALRTDYVHLPSKQDSGVFL